MIRTRRADADVPFGFAFGWARELVDAGACVLEGGPPLWHLALLNPGMADARNLVEDYLLCGAYSAERAGEIAGGLRSADASSQGHALSAAEARRAWGERFFPVTRSVLPPRFPSVSRGLVSLAELPEKLSGATDHTGHAVQGTVARSGEVLLLTLDAQVER